MEPDNPTGGRDMAVLGYIFLAILAVAVLGVIGLVLVSLPDIRRYLAIRRM